MTACSQDDDSDDEKPGSHYVELEQQAVNENALREAQEAFARRKEQSDMVCNSIPVVVQNYLLLEVTHSLRPLPVAPRIRLGLPRASTGASQAC